MKIIDVKEKANPLLSRKEVLATINFDSSTPSRRDIIKFIAAKYSTKESLVAIKKVHGRFGKKEALVEGAVYENEKAAQIEEKHVVWRALPKDKKKEAIEAKRKAKKDRKKAKKK